MTDSDRFQRQYGTYQASIERFLFAHMNARRPSSVYEPIHYILDAGGKRLRSVLTLLACEAVGGPASRALPAACALEILHTFTLVHDDVMDHSDTRRGRPTIHKKWDANVAILSGDELVAHAYRFLLMTASTGIGPILSSFTDAFIQVCEGQGYDKEFEKRTRVTVDEYVMMIEKKTARVISASLEIGALVGKATPARVRALRNFGRELGLAFQIQDDLLDVTGTVEDLGKPVGGDIVEGKKTYLYLTAMKRGGESDRRALLRPPPRSAGMNARIALFRRIYERSGTIEAARREIDRRTSLAQRHLKPLPASRAKDMLTWLAQQLAARQR